MHLHGYHIRFIHSLTHILSNGRLCRPEVYQLKLLCYRSLQAVTRDTAAPGSADKLRILRRLASLFREILAAECPPESLKEDARQDVPNLTCSFCRADLFQSFFECTVCCTSTCSEPNGPGSDGEQLEPSRYRSCPTCYVEGRSCWCSTPAAMKARQRWDFGELISAYNAAAAAINAQETVTENKVPLLSSTK